MELACSVTSNYKRAALRVDLTMKRQSRYTHGYLIRMYLTV